MPLKKSPDAFLRGAREKGSGINRDHINGERTQKKILPVSEKYYARSLALWEA
jgi:hypothetical protein